MLQYLPFLRPDYEGLEDFNRHELAGLCTLDITYIPPKFKGEKNRRFLKYFGFCEIRSKFSGHGKQIRSNFATYFFIFSVKIKLLPSIFFSDAEGTYPNDVSSKNM